MASPAFAADLARKAPPPPLPPPIQDWSGIYSGFEGGYGWGHNTFSNDNGDFSNFAGFGGVENIASVITGNSQVLFPTFNGINLGQSTDASGWLFGGFVGAQKQWGNWVIGIEADYDWASITGNVSASSVEHDVDVGFFNVSTVGVTTTTNPGQFRAVDLQILTGLAPGTVIPPGTPLGSVIFGPQGVVAFPPVVFVNTTPLTVGGGGGVIVSLAPNGLGAPGTSSLFVSVSGITASGSTTRPVLLPSTVDTDVNRSISVNTKIDQLGSVRGKFGWAWSPNWMVYGTGGLAWAHQETNVTATESFVIDERTFSDSRTASGGGTMLGWAIGGGIDYKWQIDPGSAWVFGLEYLHYGFPKNTITLADNAVATAFSNSSQSVDVIKARISYLFSIH
jgi:opacity protein-like surface antigen